MTKFEFENYDWNKGMKTLKSIMRYQKMKRPKSHFDNKNGGIANDDTK